MSRGTQSLRLDVGVRTDPGRVRANNQDWWGQFVPPDPRMLAAKGALFVVADGMGGRDNVSALVVRAERPVAQTSRQANTPIRPQVSAPAHFDGIQRVAAGRRVP